MLILGNWPYLFNIEQKVNVILQSGLSNKAKGLTKRDRQMEKRSTDREVQSAHQ